MEQGQGQEQPPPYANGNALLQLPAVPSHLPEPSKEHIEPTTESTLQQFATTPSGLPARFKEHVEPIIEHEGRQQQQQQQQRQTPSTTSSDKLTNLKSPVQASTENVKPPATSLDSSSDPTISHGTKPPLIEGDSCMRDRNTKTETLDDRVAAEALLGLGKPARQEAPTPSKSLEGYSTPLQYYPIGIEHTTTQTQGQQPEPLLSLLTSAHPWLGGTLNNSLSAYSASKSYSPRFIQYGAHLVENTVGTVGRRTGVEGSIRRFLDSRQPQDARQAPPPRIDTQIVDPETARDLTAAASESSRRASGISVESLPVYDENRSPAYEEVVGPQSPTSARVPHPNIPLSWSTQLMISTSGLGAALNENALRSLNACLSLLGSAFGHVKYLLDKLKHLLQEYNNAGHIEGGPRPGQKQSDGDVAMVDAPNTHEVLKNIAQHIKHLNAEIWATFKKVVNNVSAYTGGALPDNASAVVRWQLMSVPMRWHRAVKRAAGTSEDEAVHSANRMIEFAVEGLEMIAQVSGVLESTIRSAERWLESMGRKKEGELGGSGGEARSDSREMEKASAVEHETSESAEEKDVAHPAAA